MYKIIFTIVLVWIYINPTRSDAQKYKSDVSYVHFYSDAPMEDIEATNKDGQSVFDLESGEIVFSIPIKSFEFEKSLMQEHFNENYLESDKFPKATFVGKVEGYSKSSGEKQKAKASGVMTMHGVEQQILVEGDLTISDDVMEIQALFPIKLVDYKIKIPKVVFYNIAEVVEITVKFNYKKIE